MPVDLEKRIRINIRLDDVLQSYLDWKSELMKGNIKQNHKSRQRKVFVYKRSA